MPDLSDEEELLESIRNFSRERKAELNMQIRLISLHSDLISTESGINDADGISTGNHQNQTVLSDGKAPTRSNITLPEKTLSLVASFSSDPEVKHQQIANLVTDEWNHLAPNRQWRFRVECHKKLTKFGISVLNN